MIGIRLNSFNDVMLGEPEQDANSALTELDKGLRSSKVGEQCEAIVRFPRLFEKYPFPILINSSFLKLADVFRLGNNFLRLWILRVCQQSEKHLDKILNVDEFVRRVFNVLHSNDPVARALALQTLGAIAGIIPERQNVHHAIRRGLDSHDDVEVDAAIYATTKFAAQSNSFATSMCNKLSDMVVCEETGAERREMLVRALRTVHGGAVRAHGVLRLLRGLMQRFPSASSTRAAISALTAIADDTVVHVPDQVELLLNTVRSEPRASIRRAALQGLRTLAAHAALWPPTAIGSLAQAAASDPDHMLLCLQVMQRLVKCPAVCGHGASALQELCSGAALSGDLHIAATAATVLTCIVVHCYQECLPVPGASDLLLALESLVIATGVSDEEKNIKPLRLALRCLVQVCQAKPAHCSRTSRALGVQLRACAWGAGAVAEHTGVGAERAAALLEALCAVGAGPDARAALAPATPALRALLTRVAQQARRQREAMEMEIEDLEKTSSSRSGDGEHGRALVLLCTVVCQERAEALAGMQSEGDQSTGRAWQETVMQALSHADGWTHYRVGLAALRYGHHSLAATLFGLLMSKATTETAYRWLATLNRAATADAMLSSNNGSSRLEEAMAEYGRAAYARAGGAGGAACAAGCAGCGSCAPPPDAYVRARHAWLAALARAQTAARTLCTQPPPAIAHTQAQAARDAAARCGACAGAVRRAARAAAACANNYARIALTAFHADSASLRHLYILQHTCNQMAQFMERICTPNYQERQADVPATLGNKIAPLNLEEQLMLAVCNRLDRIATKLFDSPDTKAGITHRHMDALLCMVRVVVCSPPGWPRAVATHAPPTRCRLALSPSPRAAPATPVPAAPAAPAAPSAATNDQAVSVPYGHQLVLKVEGVIQAAAGPRGKPHRPITGVQLTITAAPLIRNTDKSVAAECGAVIVSHVQTATPLRDFFSAHQLLSLSASGLYTVAVEAAFVDERLQLWKTGPRSSITVKVLEDPSAKTNSQSARARF